MDLTEETIFLTIPMTGRDWHWLADCNVVALSDQLDCAGKARALDELQQTWRVAHLGLIDSA